MNLVDWPDLIGSRKRETEDHARRSALEQLLGGVRQALDVRQYETLGPGCSQHLANQEGDPQVVLNQKDPGWFAQPNRLHQGHVLYVVQKL